MTRRTFGFMVLGVAALAALGYRQGRPQTAAAEPNPPRSARRTAAGPAYQYVGVASCASSACHHKEGARDAAGCEYTTWIEADPHRNAYAVLFNDRSRRMAAAVLKDSTDPKQASPEKNERCLRCHATGTSGADRGSRLSLADGVGCESCHGPAEKWLSLHYLPAWQAKSADEKKKDGFAATKDLVVRTEQCAACHVGSAAAEVDHDLIAAGHPRLNFEVGNQHAKLPRHWKEKGDNATADFEARLWAMGQVVSAREALHLLEHRATATGAAWPEFSEYDCFACHHALREPSTRPGSPGAAPWGEWYYALLPALKGGIVKTPALDELRIEMRKPLAKRERVAKLARAAAGELDPQLRNPEGGKLSSSEAQRQWMRQLLIAEEKSGVHPGWDRAAQLYLGLAAHEQALDDAPLRASLWELRKPLLMPKGFDSPTTYDATKFPQALQKFRKQLEN